MHQPSDLCFAGAGIGYRRRYRDALLSENGAKPTVLEIIPEHFFADPEQLSLLASRYDLVFHEIGLSPATAHSIDEELLTRVKALFRYGKPKLFTDHLALTSSPSGMELGHLAPVWYTREVLNVVANRILRWQDFLNVPVAVENITAPFLIPEAEMTEAEFFLELTGRTGCGILLDLTNLLINSRNFEIDPFINLHQYPLHRVQQVHLAGGKCVNGWWVDSHSRPLEQTSLELLESLRGNAPLIVAIVERDENLPPFAELVEETIRVEQIWLHGIRRNEE